MLVVLLIGTMLRSENNVSLQLSDKYEQLNIETTARIAQLDVMQTFNYAIRREIEKWLNENTFTTDKQEVWADWNALVRAFVEGRFGGEEGEQFAFTLATRLMDLYSKYGFTFYNYHVYVEKTEQVKLKEILDELVKQSVKDENFIEVIECDGTPSGCPKGTFYINLYLSRLDDSTYEKLPYVTVEDRSTGKKVRNPVLPKRDIKLYVPVRIFKALTVARAITHTELGSGVNGPNDYGLLSSRVHNELDEIALGMCDYGFCRPRENINNPPPNEKNISSPPKRYVGTPRCCYPDAFGSPYLNCDECGCCGLPYCPCQVYRERSCPKKEELPNSYPRVKRVRGDYENEGHIKYFIYNPSDSSDMKDKLKKIALEKICTYAKRAVQLHGLRNLATTDKFELYIAPQYQGISAVLDDYRNTANRPQVQIISDCPLFELTTNMEAIARGSKAILRPGRYAPTSTEVNIYPNSSSGVCPASYPNPYGGFIRRSLGVVGSGKNAKWPYYPGTEKIIQSEKCGDVRDLGGLTEAQCIEISRYGGIVKIEEKDPNYKVNNNLKVVFNIGIVDRFPAFNPNYSAGMPTASGCGFAGITGPNCNMAGWRCYEYKPPFRPYINCYPDPGSG
jgi:hypothetical protein